ncbi:MAG TPA: hypothetical protein VKA87_04120 [Nitrososphaeraceae archaeon]|nr:hypothetical protein [Nitrososphaeraceae archaeon]
MSEGNPQNKKKKLEDSPYRSGAPTSISAEDLKRLKLNQQLPFEPPSSLSSHPAERPKEKVKQQEQK